MRKKWFRTVCAAGLLAFGLAAPAARTAQRHGAAGAQAGARYEHALDALDAGHWEKAAAEFQAVAARGGPHADAALYWQAYAEEKLGRLAPALAILEKLEGSYPQSRWLDDARALELEVRVESGQMIAPDQESNLELKLLALNALALHSPHEAVPLVEKMLEGPTPLRVKRQALFVLAQSRSPQARTALVRVARSDASPELRGRAVEYVALFGGPEGQRSLEELYGATGDLAIKRQILHSFMIAGQRERLLQAAKDGKAPELQQQAIRDLGVLGAQNDLGQLYRAELPVETRRHILQALFVTGNQQKLYALAQNEKTPELRREAIRDLGLLSAAGGSAPLATLYRGAQDRDGSRTIIEALFLSGNAKALVELARRETDPKLKREMIQKLALMDSKPARDYLKQLVSK
jgi:tetratricopeptide (TPR) repeat protein